MMANSTIGIDIGSFYTKVVEIEYKGGRPALSTFFIFKSPFLPSRDSSLPGQIDRASFWKQFSSHLSLSRLKKSKVGISLSPGLVSTLVLSLPKIGKCELSQAAIVEAKRKMIPVSGPGHAFEWLLLGEKIAAKIPRYEVLIVRTEKLYIQQIIELGKDAGVTPELIAPACGIFSQIIPEEGFKKDEDIAFVEFGARDLNISIHRMKKLIFFRSVTFGMTDIISDLSRKLQVSQDKTEEIIRRDGVPPAALDLTDKVALAEEIMRQKYEAGLKAGEARQKNEANPLELRALWQAHIERILHELRRSLAYYKEQSEGRRAESIYLLGGGFQIRNLAEILMKQIGGKWQIVLPFKNLEIGAFKEKQFREDISSAPIFTGATAIALAIAAKGAPVINFLPLELKRKKILAARFIVLLAGLGSFIVISIFPIVSLMINHRLLKADLQNAELELNKFKSVTGGLNDLKEEQRDINQAFSQIDEAIKKRPDFSYVLKTFARIIPPEILLIQLSISEVNPASGSRGMDVVAQTSPSEKKYLLEMKAEVFADFENANIILDNLQSQLASLSCFRDINISPLKLEEILPRINQDKGQGFSLTLPGARPFSLTAEIIFNK